MANIITTAADLAERLNDYLGDNAGPKAQRDIKRAIGDAYREVATAHAWTYLYKEYKIIGQAPYSTGTIEYEHSGGTSPRLVTLTGGTWPDWANLGMLVIGLNTYEVATVLSGTTLQLDINSNPGADLDPLTAYSLMRDSYPMPPDFTTSDRLLAPGGMQTPAYVRPGAWMNMRSLIPQQNIPYLFTFMGDDRYMGTLSLRLFPAPSDATQYEAIYQRKMRPLTVWDYHTGTVTTAPASAELVGVGTTWTDRMIGSVVRVSENARDLPTSPEGANPAAYERIVMDVVDSTHLTVDLPFDVALAGVKHIISDPVDVADGNMLNCLIACAVMHVSFGREKKDQGQAAQRYARALNLAREADCVTSLMPRGVGMGGPGSLPMREYPVGGTVS